MNELRIEDTKWAKQFGDSTSLTGNYGTKIIRAVDGGHKVLAEFGTKQEAFDAFMEWLDECRRLWSDGEPLVLVSCVSVKGETAAPAADLYRSPWFIKARAFAESTGRRWFILSALHGLLTPDTVVEPYNVTLDDLDAAGRRKWAVAVDDALYKAAPRIRRVVILAGTRYREHLGPLIESRKVRVEVPMEGLGIGEQLAWLTRQKT